MNKLVLLISVLTAAVCNDAFAVASPRKSMADQMRAAPRAGVASKTQIATLTPDTEVVSKSSVKADNVEADLNLNSDETLSVQKDLRKKERLACVSNNIGVGNTFVWASRYSDTSNYATMIEDTEEPENNTCFVKTALKSMDSRIDVSNVPVRYFEMGQTVTCGDWADYESLKQQILDAKKKGRTLGTVASVVGAAGVAVGAMELFGNKLIGGKVEGQAAMSADELLRSQLLTLKEKDTAKYNSFMTSLRNLKADCEKFEDKYSDQEVPSACVKYEGVFTLLDGATK